MHTLGAVGRGEVVRPGGKRAFQKFGGRRSLDETSVAIGRLLGEIETLTRPMSEDRLERVSVDMRTRENTVARSQRPRRINGPLTKSGQ
jgi:hypothetical protein